MGKKLIALFLAISLIPLFSVVMLSNNSMDNIGEPSKALETPVNEKYLEGILKEEGKLILLTDLLSLVNSMAGKDIEKAESFTEDM
ncbi:MAG: hypothetical protein ACOC7O_01835 [Thermoplasmatota archaeon]